MAAPDFNDSSMTSSNGCTRAERSNGSVDADSGRSSIRRPAGFRIRTSPLRSDHDQAGGQARNDLAVQAL